jgi:hypothetical protein
MLSSGVPSILGFLAGGVDIVQEPDDAAFPDMTSE